MFKPLSLLSTLALVALAGQGLTQTTETAAEPPAEVPAAVADPAAELLDMGRPEGPGLGDRYAKEKHGDWDLACIKTESDQDPCSLVQILTDDKGQAMAEFNLFRLKGGGQAVAGATVIVPLETLLPAQLSISIDGAPGKRYNYSFCNPIGCVAQIGLTEADISAMKKGSEAIVSLVPAPAPDQTVKLKLSLKGFTAGYEKSDVVSNE